MDLIERLGGYERAKEIAFDPLHPQMTHVSNDGRHWVNENFSYIPEIQSQIPKMARIDDIRKALLEYRRQHNIFEVGDFIFHPMFGALFEIKRIAERYVVASTKSGYETNLLIELISHATDAEIAAGKRLEVNHG